jgi:hypothetical protein
VKSDDSLKTTVRSHQPVQQLGRNKICWQKKPKTQEENQMSQRGNQLMILKTPAAIDKAFGIRFLRKAHLGATNN